LDERDGAWTFSFLFSSFPSFCKALLNFVRGRLPMQKKPYFKLVALAILMGFLFLSAPGLSCAEKKASKFDFRLLIKKPVVWISSVLNMFIPISDSGNNSTSKITTPDKSSPKIKPLGDILVVRPSRGD
jgi:hypothetical protein